VVDQVVVGLTRNVPERPLLSEAAHRRLDLPHRRTADRVLADPRLDRPDQISPLSCDPADVARASKEEVEFDAVDRRRVAQAEEVLDEAFLAPGHAGQLADRVADQVGVPLRGVDQVRHLLDLVERHPLTGEPVVTEGTADSSNPIQDVVGDLPGLDGRQQLPPPGAAEEDGHPLLGADGPLPPGALCHEQLGYLQVQRRRVDLFAGPHPLDRHLRLVGVRQLRQPQVDVVGAGSLGSDGDRIGPGHVGLGDRPLSESFPAAQQVLQDRRQVLVQLVRRGGDDLEDRLVGDGPDLVDMPAQLRGRQVVEVVPSDPATGPGGSGEPRGEGPGAGASGDSSPGPGVGSLPPGGLVPPQITRARSPSGRWFHPCSSNQSAVSWSQSGIRREGLLAEGVVLVCESLTSLTIPPEGVRRTLRPVPLVGLRPVAEPLVEVLGGRRVVDPLVADLCPVRDLHVSPSGPDLLQDAGHLVPEPRLHRVLVEQDGERDRPVAVAQGCPAGNPGLAKQLRRLRRVQAAAEPRLDQSAGNLSNGAGLLEDAH